MVDDFCGIQFWTIQIATKDLESSKAKLSYRAPGENSLAFGIKYEG
jgi:hypothetical protein